MRISKLSALQRMEGRWLVHLEDGDHPPGGGERGGLLRASAPGWSWTARTCAALEDAARRRQVKEKALELLSARPMSRKELTGQAHRPPRDTEGAASARTAEEAADWLEGLGYLNDEEYARTVVRHYAAKGLRPRPDRGGALPAGGAPGLLGRGRWRRRTPAERHGRHSCGRSGARRSWRTPRSGKAVRRPGPPGLPLGGHQRRPASPVR